MKTTEVKTATLNNKAENTNSPTKINGLPVSTAFDGDSKKEEAKKAETPVTVQPEQPKEGQVNAGTEPTKKEVKEGLKEKIIFDFDSTIKLVEELHRKKIQRDKLLNTINTLEAFEVAQQEDAEETDSNNFQGCIMTIQDDKRREFTTKNPVIIQEAAQHVNAMCLTKLAEIEAGIVIPS